MPKTTQIFTFDDYGSGNRATVTSGNGLYIAAGVTVGSTDVSAIAATGEDDVFEVQGTLFGTAAALSLSAGYGILTIGKAGAVRADMDTGTAVDADGFNLQIDNRGEISGKTGIGFKNVDNVSVSNYGTISAQGDSISFDAASGGTNYLFNYGKMETTAFFSQAGYSSLGTGTDIVINAGVMACVVSLGDGDDTYFGINEKAVTTGFYSAIFVLQGLGTLGSLVVGGDGKDALSGGKYVDVFNGGSGNDTLSAGGGKDQLTGGTGGDLLTGGSAADRFVFNASNESKGSTRDHITDFSHKQHDLIELDFDADIKLVKGQDFTFIGDTAFHGKAGELRFHIGSEHTVIYGDTNGDKKSDFLIELDSKVHLVAGDFIL